MGHQHKTLYGKSSIDDKPDCLEGQAHHWIFPTGTGSTKIFGARAAGSSFYSASEVRINYKRTATCQICEQTYTFGAITSPYNDNCRCDSCLYKRGKKHGRGRSKRSRNRRKNGRKN